MSLRTLVVAPHADDELLGCGGTLLRRKAEGGVVGWLLFTSLSSENCNNPQRILTRESEVDHVRNLLGISSQHFYSLGFNPAELDRLPASRLVASVSSVFNDFRPDELLLPHPADIHSDHRVAFAAASSCIKSFRYPFIKRVLAYETLSETDFSLPGALPQFQPNYLVDISAYLEAKLSLLATYKSELGSHPFPRSLVSIKSLANLRGVQRGTAAAEAFHMFLSHE